MLKSKVGLSKLFGILGLVLQVICCCSSDLLFAFIVELVAFILAIAAIVTACMAKKEGDKATLGLVCGIIGVVLGLLGMLVLILGMMSFAMIGIDPTNMGELSPQELMDKMQEYMEQSGMTVQ